MKGKTFIILGLGAAGGFIGGNAFAFSKMMKSDEMREALSSILASKITKILFGDEPLRTTSKVSYRNYYDSVRYRDFCNKTRHPSCYAVEEIIFDTEAEAEKILEQLRELIDQYGCVCVQDFYDLCGLPDKYRREGKWGWTNLSNVYILKHKDGWIIDMPKIVPVS